jgi:DNA adenine methylase
MSSKTRKRKIYPRPFLKWLGGKRQLLPEYEKRFPDEILKNKSIKRYVEPFVGAGALFFFLTRNYDLKESYLFDINPELTMAYTIIKDHHKDVLEKLRELEDNYLTKRFIGRKRYYYHLRKRYNHQLKGFDFYNFNEGWIERTSLLIFLNKTCFNGLFRFNKKGEFNVPTGRYEKPHICDERNIIAVNKALKNTQIINADFSVSENFIEKDSLVYLDPPYRPLNKTSRFTSYTKNVFTDADQQRLAVFFKKMDHKGAYLMLSDSDPKNENPDDEFFDNLYGDYLIERVMARRLINRNILKRGEIKELIIRNYS